MVDPGTPASVKLRAADSVLEHSARIGTGIRLIAPVSDKPGTLELRELSRAMNTPAGLVLIVGC
jgi:7,8-dihydropterin-6-yl-methyl-4-(beta-D-ribofuranosyl)aminobenzene 5'-phosphate synthase